MKKLLALLLCLSLCLPALAEEAPAPGAIPSSESIPAEDASAIAESAEDPLAPYALLLPEGVTLQASGGTSVIFRHANGSTRAVAMVSARVLDEEGNHQAELIRLMSLFSPEAEALTPLTLAEGLHGVAAVTPYALEGSGESRVSQLTVMLLHEGEVQGELLILSAYDMAGDDEAAEAFLRLLIEALTVDGQPVLPAQVDAAVEDVGLGLPEEH